MADAPRELKKLSAFGCYEQKDAQYCRFSGYDLHYALYCKFPSWGSWGSGAIGLLTPLPTCAFTPLPFPHFSLFTIQCNSLLEKMDLKSCRNMKVVIGDGCYLFSFIFISSKKADTKQNDTLVSNVLMNGNAFDDEKNDKRGAKLTSSELLFRAHCSTAIDSVELSETDVRLHYLCKEKEMMGKLLLNISAPSGTVGSVDLVILQVIVSRMVLLSVCLLLSGLVSFSPLVLFSRWRNKISWEMF